MTHAPTRRHTPAPPTPFPGPPAVCRYKEELIREYRTRSFRIDSTDLYSVELRRYMLEQNAVEIFTSDSRSFFLAFGDRATRDRVVRAIRKVCCRHAVT